MSRESKYQRLREKRLKKTRSSEPMWKQRRRAKRKPWAVNGVEQGIVKP